MLIEFDPAKDAKNQVKHGIALADAEFLDWETVKGFDANHHAYGELRRVGYGFLKGRLHAVY